MSYKNGPKLVTWGGRFSLLKISSAPDRGSRKAPGPEHLEFLTIFDSSWNLTRPEMSASSKSASMIHGINDLVPNFEVVGFSSCIRQVNLLSVQEIGHFPIRRSIFFRRKHDYISDVGSAKGRQIACRRHLPEKRGISHLCVNTFFPSGRSHPERLINSSEYALLGHFWGPGIGAFS